MPISSGALPRIPQPFPIASAADFFPSSEVWSYQGEGEGGRQQVPLARIDAVTNTHRIRRPVNADITLLRFVSGEIIGAVVLQDKGPCQIANLPKIKATFGDALRRQTQGCRQKSAHRSCRPRRSLWGAGS